MKVEIYLTLDNASMRNEAQLFLDKEGYNVHCFENSDQLYEALLYKKCDVAILDVGKPVGEGFVVCTRIKQMPNAPAVILVGEASDENHMMSTFLGVDAYFVKPFSSVKLIAYVRVLLVKKELQKTSLPDTPFVPVENENGLKYADVAIYPSKWVAFCNNKMLKLTNIEYRMLSYMLENQDRAMSRAELKHAIWGIKSVNKRVTDDVIKRLRKKLSAAGSVITIEVVWGHGFRLTVYEAQAKHALCPV